MVTVFGAGYYFLEKYQGEPRTLVECLYFVWITFASIGYTDEGFTGGTIFRVVTILMGTYLITRFIVLSANIYARVVVEQVYDLKVLKEMNKSLIEAEGHFLLFGDDSELINKIIQGLVNGHQVYLVDENRKFLQEFKEQYQNLKYIVAKPFKSETVDMLRPERAKGAYLLYRDDEKNILLSAMLENRVKVISTFSGNEAAVQRFRRVGVEPISPHFSGGLKMVSTMIRPKSTEFLDRFLFPHDSPLEFRMVPYEEYKKDRRQVSLAGVEDGKVDFNLSPEQGKKVLVVGFKDLSFAGKKIGRLEAPDLPVRRDKFLVLGGGIIGSTIINELMATRREVMVVEPSEDKINELRKKWGTRTISYIVSNSTRDDYNVEEFDAVAICTPVDEKNFAIGLDFVGSRLLRVVRAVDDDMEFHYHRIGAIPVFIGKVGSNRMLREVTNQFANEILQVMLAQNHRIDQAYISGSATVSELEEEFDVRVIALCRNSTCYFGVGEKEKIQAGDTLIFCGHVDANRKLRLHHRLDD